jgi:exonuclease III
MAQREAVMTKFRIGTVNVHSFRSPFSRKSNAKVLASILAPYNLDVLAVEEMRNDSNWTSLHEQLSLNYSIVGLSGGLSFGNAIASRHPIIDYSNKISEHEYVGGTRAMLQCRFGGDHPFIKNRRFAVTHLDHFDEGDRLMQINEFAPYNHNINILVGDMNALTQNDYSDKYLRDIITVKREQNGWEKPRFELTELLTTTWGFQDAFRSINSELKDARVVTCPYGTRIDYIYHHPLRNDEWKLTECFIVDTRRSTDHNAVIATFELKPKPN